MKNQQNKTASQRRASDESSNESPTTGFDWNDLQYFLAEAREGGLSKAGLALGSSASTVSRHITALEQHLRVRLFVRLSTADSIGTYVLAPQMASLRQRHPSLARVGCQ